jgi:hypothetical protein
LRKADEVSAPSVGEAGEGEIQIEAPSGSPSNPQEVEGYEKECQKEQDG